MTFWMSYTCKSLRAMLVSDWSACSGTETAYKSSVNLCVKTQPLIGLMNPITRALVMHPKWHRSSLNIMQTQYLVSQKASRMRVSLHQELEFHGMLIYNAKSYTHIISQTGNICLHDDFCIISAFAVSMHRWLRECKLFWSM